MIKKLIFDIDNTLIQWEDEKNWKEVYINLNKKYKITLDDMNVIRNILNNYEDNEKIYDMEKMQKKINKFLKQEYATDFLKIILKTFETCVPDVFDVELEKVLEYLSSKYELVALTNWFEEQQRVRMENYRLLKYFKAIYGADHFEVKPNKQAFLVAMGNNKPEECVVIGDNLKIDIKGAIRLGIKAILFSKSKIEIQNENYVQIDDLKKLKEIL